MKLFLFFLTLFGFYNSFSQNPLTFKVQKSDNHLFFFQKGKELDTISKTEGNIFYLIVRDTLKDKLTIVLENCQLIKTSNDSIFKLNYVKGIAYEAMFTKTVSKQYRDMAIIPKDVIKYEFKCLINGTSNEENNRMTIRFKEKGNLNFLLENNFYFKD
jgi:hypothetical protein